VVVSLSSGRAIFFTAFNPVFLFSKMPTGERPPLTGLLIKSAFLSVEQASGNQQSLCVAGKGPSDIL